MGNLVAKNNNILHLLPIKDNWNPLESPYKNKISLANMSKHTARLIIHSNKYLVLLKKNSPLST